MPQQSVTVRLSNRFLLILVTAEGGIRFRLEKATSISAKVNKELKVILVVVVVVVVVGR